MPHWRPRKRIQVASRPSELVWVPRNGGPHPTEPVLALVRVVGREEASAWSYRKGRNGERLQWGL